MTSTSEVYGTAQYGPDRREASPARPVSLRGDQDRADALGESYHRAFGLPVSILRPFNTFGPRQSARAIIPTIISQALSRPVVKLGRLDPRRDLTYVKDTVEGFVAIAACDAALGRAVNIGRGDDISIGELVETDRRSAWAGRSASSRRADRVRPAASEVERTARRHRPGSVTLRLEAAIQSGSGPRGNDCLGPRPPRPVPPGRLHHMR